MNRIINQIILTFALLLAGVGSASALSLVDGGTSHVDVKFYVSDAVPTAAPTGAEATTVTAGQYVILVVTPETGYWLDATMLTLQWAGSLGGAESPMRRAILQPVNPTAASTNALDGKGYYYCQVPDFCTDENGYKNVVIRGEALQQTSVTVTITGHTDTQPYKGTEQSVSGYDVAISKPALYSTSDFTFSGTAEAKRTNAGSTNMGLAASQFTNTKPGYDVTFTVASDGSLTVQKVDLKLTAEDKSRLYGEADPLFTFKGEGFVNGETSAVLSKQPTLSTKATLTSIAGKYAILISGAEATNYNLSYQNGVLTIEESPDDHSGIRVIRNDTKELVHNVAVLTEVMVGESKTLRIDKVTIDAPQDASATNPVSVSVYIPATLEEYEGTKLPIYGVGADIIATEDYVPVTDIYLPNTEKMINVAVQAFRLDAQERVTARIHTSLPLLDDYALTPGLKKEYEDSHVMTTVTRNTKYWTLSCGVDLICPEAATAYTCQPDGNSAVAAVAITSNTVMVGNDERVVIKANNGVLMGNDDEEGGDYDLVASPSSDRPNGTPPTTDDAKTYEGNLMVPALIETHFEPSQYYILYHDLFHELQEDDNTSVSPCKAVLRKGYGSMLSRLRIELDEEPTGIETVDSGQLTVDSWYTINGVKLDEQPTEKGVYIHNGKKVVIK